MKFIEHLKKPKNNYRPPFFSVKLSYAADEKNKATLFLDINQHDEILSCHFECVGFSYIVPYFSALSEMVTGISVDDAGALSSEDFIDFFEEDEDFLLMVEEHSIPFINVSLLLFHNALREFKGQFIAPFENKKLLCRCFGVFTSDIEKLVLKNPTLTIEDIIKETKATAGCGGCATDLADLYYDLREKRPHKAIPKMIYRDPNSQDSKTWEMDFNFWIQNFIAEKNIKIEVDVESFLNNTLTIKLISGKFTPQEFQEFSLFLKKKSELDLTIIL